MGIPNENTRVVLSLWLTALLVPACGGCSSSSSNPDAGDGSTDTDSDTNTDSDSGTDTDADTDTDTNGCWWEQMESGTTGNFFRIWGLSDTEIYTAYTDVDAGDAIVLRYDGANWSPEWVFPGYSAGAIWGLSSDDLFLSVVETSVVDPKMKHFDGTEWTDMSQDLLLLPGSIWASGDDNVLAVGSDYMQRFDGSSWSTVWQDICMPEEECTAVRAVWGAAPDDVFVVGVHSWPYPAFCQNFILHYDGVEFTEMPVLDANSAGLTDVYGVSATEVYAVGNDVEFEDTGVNMSTVLRYDGGAWAPIGVFDNDYYLAGVWADGNGNVFAAGRKIFHYHGGEWTTYELLDYPWLNDIWGTDLDHLFAVGLNGTIFKYTCPE